MKKIAICTPSGRAPVPAYNTSLYQTLFSCREGYQVGIISDVGHANTPRIRNVLTQTARDHGFDVIVFIDDDISWDVATFWALIEDEAPVVGVAPRARRDDLSEMAFGAYLKDKIDENRYTGNVATAFLKIDCAFFDEFEPKTDWFNYEKLKSEANPDGIARVFFHYEVGENVSGDSRGYIGEDYWFSNFCRKNGVEPVVRVDLGVSHWHLVPLGGVLKDYL